MVGVLTLVLGAADCHREIDCEAAVHGSPLGVAASVCQREFDDTRQPITGIRLAESLRQSGRRQEAQELARGLLATSSQADAWQILGNIAREVHQLDEATVFLELARSQHRARGARSDVARDDQALSTVLRGRQRYDDALLALDECVTETRAVRDRSLESICHLAAEGVLLKIGLLDLAATELELAAAIARAMPAYDSREGAQLAYMRGNLEQEMARGARHLNHDKLAIEAFQQALVLNQSAQVSSLTVALELNLAYSLANGGRCDEAAAHLAEARRLDLEHDHDVEAIQIEAQIAYRRGDVKRASALNSAVYSRSDAGDQVDLAVMQARIALANHDLTLAETWAKQGVDKVEEIRASQGTLELRPWVLSTRRAAYELWFLALARAGRTEDALFAFDQWQGRTLVDALVTRASKDGLPAAAREVTQLGAWLPVASRAAFARVADRQGVLAALGAIDLLALVVAEGELWCLTSRQGQLRARNLGRLGALQGRLDQFMAVPTDRALASELGELLLSDGIARPTTSALHVILDGALAALPVVALRVAAPSAGRSAMAPDHDDRPLIALRPVIRVPRLPEARCVPARRATHATVLADAFGDLPQARSEAATLATLLAMPTTTSLGTSATSTALFATPSDALLHLAVHADIAAGSGVLKLHDKDVSALEISARKLGASLVVLSACESARSTVDDTELAGSLATAFLAAGSSQVIATLRAVSDRGAAELSTRFYRADGLSDPARGLAQAQAALAETSDTDWPRFAIFGHDLCPSTP